MERFTIEQNKHKDGRTEIMVFDHNRKDKDYPDQPLLFALYNENEVNYVGQRNYKTLNTWERAVEDSLCIDINWNKLEAEGSLLFN